MDSVVWHGLEFLSELDETENVDSMKGKKVRIVAQGVTKKGARKKMKEAKQGLKGKD